MILGLLITFRPRQTIHYRPQPKSLLAHRARWRGFPEPDHETPVVKPSVKSAARAHRVPASTVRAIGEKTTSSSLFPMADSQEPLSQPLTGGDPRIPTRYVKAAKQFAHRKLGLPNASLIIAPKGLGMPGPKPRHLEANTFRHNWDSWKFDSRSDLKRKPPWTMAGLLGQRGSGR